MKPKFYKRGEKRKMKQYIVTTDKGNTFTIRANNQYEAKQRTYLCNEKIRSIQGVTKSGKLQKKIIY